MIADNMKQTKLYESAHAKFAQAFAFIEQAVCENYAAGKYEIDGKDLYASVQEYDSKLDANAKFEGHHNYIDIQYVVSGAEIIKVADIAKMIPKGDYNPDKDVEFYQDNGQASALVLNAGEYAILMRRSFLVVQSLIMGGCTTGTSAIYEYAATVIGPRR